MSNKIALFLHIFPSNKFWKSCFLEQMQNIFISGLYEACEFVHIGINAGPDFVFPYVFDKFRITYNKNHDGETDTLLSLHDFCSSNTDYKIFYSHIKGVTRVINGNCYPEIKAWVMSMEYFNVFRWKSNVKLLDEYDCVGSEWYSNKNYYAGNFWWANSLYISKLDKEYLDVSNRSKDEYWVGTGNPKYYNHFSFHNTPQVSGSDSTKLANDNYDLKYNPLLYIKETYAS